MIIWTSITKSLLPSRYTKVTPNYPSLAIFSLPHRQARGATCLREVPPFGTKAGGRFSEQYVFSINLKIAPLSLSPLAGEGGGEGGGQCKGEENCWLFSWFEGAL